MQVCMKDAYKIRLNGQAGRQKREEDTLRIAVLTPSFAFYDYMTISVPPQTNTKKHKKTMKKISKHTHIQTHDELMSLVHISPCELALYHSIHRLTVRQIWILLELVKKRREEKH